MTTSTLSATAVTTLTPYAGEWGAQQAAHLLRRATFAPTKSEIDIAVSLGLAGTIDELFAVAPLPAPPIYFDYDGNPDAGLGQTWVDLAISSVNNQQDRNARRRSYETWLLRSTATTGMKIREKMVFFWLNHFGIGFEQETRALYRMITRFRENGTGNFRQLVKDMTIDPLMLRFLNGNTSTRQNPNENFAREILELYTIGKGPQVAPGDYTTYTELDVTELAKAFTGWVIRNYNTQTPGETVYSEFVPNRHDTTTKTLSVRFGFAEIENADEVEYANVVDLIFTRDEVATYICRKLYRQFVYYTITDDIEANVIAPMAQILIDEDYNIAPALSALLTSEHFFEMKIMGDTIKSPLEFVHSILRPTGYYERETEAAGMLAARRAFFHCRDTGMDLLNPPSVAGWTAYYQEPSYYRLWLNTTTIQLRTTFIRDSTVRWHRLSGVRYYVDWLGLLESFADPFDPNLMIEEMATRLMPQPLDAAQLTGIKELLLPGLEDFVWTGEYAEFIANPNDDGLRESVNTRLTEMMFGMLQLAEFQVH
ncbi:MAG: DUF1800 domain-containing protein [Bacteroidota bacterium]